MASPRQQEAHAGLPVLHPAAGRSDVSSPLVENGHSEMRDTEPDSHGQFSLWHIPKGITKNAMTKKKKKHPCFLPTGLSCHRAAGLPGLSPGLSPSRGRPGAQDQMPAQAPGCLTPQQCGLGRMAPLRASQKQEDNKKSLPFQEEILTKRLERTMPVKAPRTLLRALPRAEAVTSQSPDPPPQLMQS